MSRYPKYDANQLFSFPRWRQLVALHWVENRKRYALSLLAIAGLLAAWFSFILAMDHIDPLNIFFQYSAYFVGLFFTGCLFASSLFSQLSEKREAIGFLSLPASHFEKLLCALLFGTLLFFIAFTLVFYLVDIPMVGLANRIIAAHPRNFPNSTELVPALAIYNVYTAKAGPLPEEVFHVFLFGFFSAQSAFLLGSVYFNRYAFIKTAIVGVLCMLSFIVVESEVISRLLPKDWHNNFLEWDRNGVQEPATGSVRLPAMVQAVVILLLQYGLPLFFWFVTLQRLKEKEV
jgi:hypothetical protein